MAIAGIGADIITVSRIEVILRNWSDYFLSSFTSKEVQIAAQHEAPSIYYAAIFALKEAILKSLGTDWADGVEWTDIEVIMPPRTRPDAIVRNKVRVAALEKGIEKWLLSVTYTRNEAVAIAVAEYGVSESQ